MSNVLFKYLGEGAARTVYEIDDNLVIKIAKDMTDKLSWGIEQCKNELEAYIKYGDKIPLCKILVDSSNETRILMERVIPYKTDQSTEDYEMNLDLLITNLEHYPDDVEEFLKNYPNEKFVNFARKFKESGLTQDEIRDILYDVGYENLGEDANGEIIILDYGMKYS